MITSYILLGYDAYFIHCFSFNLNTVNIAACHNEFVYMNASCYHCQSQEKGSMLFWNWSSRVHFIMLDFNQN